MDDIQNAPDQHKIEEANTVCENRESVEGKIEKFNTILVTQKDLVLSKSNENGNLPINCDNPTNGHRPVIAQVAPMTSIVRRSVEEVGQLNALQNAVSISQSMKQEHEVQSNSNFAVSSAPMAVSVAMSREISGSAIESNSCDYNASTTNSGHIKRPMNAFLIWSTARRHQIKLGEPNITMAEISKRLGEEWKNMGNEERQPFVDRSKQLREEHMARYPNYKYQPRRRKPSNTSSSSNQFNSATTGRIKSIKSTPRIEQQVMTNSCDMSLHQPPQQDLNQRDPSGYQDHIAVSHSPTGTPSSNQSVHQFNQLQQPQQTSSTDILGQQSQQIIAINTSTALPQNQLTQQQIIQPVNDGMITASAVPVNQWPATIYPGLTLMGYHMTSNGMVPLYAPTQPMLPLISLPTATVGSVLQPRNSTTVEATLEEQQHQTQSQHKQSDHPQQAVLSMYAISGSERNIATVDISPGLANEVKVSPTTSVSVSTERKVPVETSVTKDVGGEDICESRTREVVSFTQI